MIRSIVNVDRENSEWKYLYLPTRLPNPILDDMFPCHIDIEVAIVSVTF